MSPQHPTQLDRLKQRKDQKLGEFSKRCYQVFGHGAGKKLLAQLSDEHQLFEGLGSVQVDPIGYWLNEGARLLCLKLEVGTENGRKLIEKGEGPDVDDT